MELLQQDAHLDRVFVPVGGGGLALDDGGVTPPPADGVGLLAMRNQFGDDGRSGTAFGMKEPP